MFVTHCFTEIKKNMFFYRFKWLYGSPAHFSPFLNPNNNNNLSILSINFGIVKVKLSD